MDNTAQYNEKELLLKIAEGDEKAFNVLVHQYWNTFFSHALAYLKSVEKAEETTQDIFMRVWQARQTLPAVNSLKDYLFIVARNQIYNEARKKIMQLYLPLENQEAGYASPVQETEFKETYQLLLQGIEALPEQRRKIFKMSRLEGMSNKQIAANLSMHKDTVYQYIVKALNFLKIYLKEHYEDSGTSSKIKNDN